MVTLDKQIADGFSSANQTFYGLSTDDKPTGTGNGSFFLEMDTGKAYLFNADASEWIELQGGGSGGGGSASGMVVEFTFVKESNYVQYFKSDKLGEEVVTAYKSGTPVVFHFPAEQSWYTEETWGSVSGYFPDGNDSDSTEKQFLVDAKQYMSGNISSIYIDDDGYIHAEFYVD